MTQAVVGTACGGLALVDVFSVVNIKIAIKDLKDEDFGFMEQMSSQENICIRLPSLRKPLLCLGQRVRV